MTILRFGTAGIPLSAKEDGYEGAIRVLTQLGLNAMEIEFVRGVNMPDATADFLKKETAKNDIALTVHAPYFINLNSAEKAKIAASKERIIGAAIKGASCGAVSVVFHAAFYMGAPAEKTFQNVKAELEDITGQLEKRNISIQLRPELTGKPTQFGDLDEIIRLSAEVPGIFPCVDFAHYHARYNGKYNSYKDFRDAIKKIRAGLGDSAVQDMHIHMSGIKYTPKGEVKHLELAESDIDYKGLLKALKDEDAGGIIISESPNIEQDAVLMQEYFKKL
ncbi:MAG: TIM barrel protein [Planctomycetes bacterium]|nr:TIM barrel protein [Planctomycetota bacterium]